jgi:hypothetical protein
MTNQDKMRAAFDAWLRNAALSGSRTEE